MNKLTVDLTGARFGRWLVLEYAGSHGRGSQWLCRCSCGAEQIVRKTNLTSGQSTGCLTCRKGNRLEEGESSKRIFYNSYRKAAGKRGYTFTLSFDQFVELTTQDCHYCGAMPESKGNMAFKGCNGIYKHNGLDRKDNRIGYEYGNVLPCCPVCNILKGTLSYDEFIAKAKQIAAKHA